MNCLELKGLSKDFGGRKVLDRIDLVVRQGEIFTILGPSGVGKSTILKIVIGLVTPDSGEIYLQGKRISDVPMNHRSISMVFQDYSTFPHMTVEENVAFPLVAQEVRGVPSYLRWLTNRNARQSIKQRVHDALVLVRLTDHAAKRPEQLSGGEQQRVAIARAFVRDPDLICLDEPFSALDKNLRKELQLEIRRIQSELGKTIVFVTHDQEDAFLVSSRIAVVRNGCIEQVGTPSEVYGSPRTVFVARFLGECNLYSVDSWEGVEGMITLRTANGTTLSARPSQGNAPRCVGIRPERLQLSGLSAEPPFLRGTVEGLTFHGASARVQVGLPTGDSIQVATSETDGLPSLDAVVTITYSPEDLILFEEELSGMPE
ncbi:ABC transporter ATP-binding protein [Candidatus Eisenbacteria bacterium]|uniref:ABC transporter ATP-binding protein n=1 Tax=Eiseniibacteriota bacterium TaxID=2212470 RepID=A0ABV6YKQ2_UNCEI